MSKEIHALKDRSGQIFWPATATDAIIHPKTRSSLTDHIEKYNLTGDNTVDSLEDGIAKLVTLGISQHLGVQIEILNTSGILEEWTYYDPSKLFSNPAGWRRGGEVDDTLDATSENPVQNKVIYQALVENEEIAASALADLDDRVSDLEDYDLNTRVSDLESIDYEPRFQEIEETIDQNEEITTEALCNLDSRIRDIEAGSTTGEVINFSETKYIDVVEGNGTDISSGDVSGRQFTVTEDDYYSEEIDNFYPNLEVRYSTTGSGVVYIPLFPTGVDGTLTFTSNQVRVGDYNYLAEIDNNYLNIRRTLAGTGSIRTLPVPNTSTPLAVGDTYDEAFGKIKKIISDNEVVTAAGLTDLNRRVVGITDTLTTKADLVNGTVPAAQLPSYVDDVLEYENLAGFPQSGETGKIYVALDTNLTYRWSGTAYVEISKSIVPYVIDLSSLTFSGTDNDKANGVFEHKYEGSDYHDRYEARANELPVLINISEILAAIENKQDIYFTDDRSGSVNNYLVTYSYKYTTTTTQIRLEARSITHDSIYWVDFGYNSTGGLVIERGFWPFRKDVNQIKNSIVILPGSIITGLLDPNAQVEANSYYAMDMGKFTSGYGIATLYSNQELYDILAGSTSFSSDANLIRPVLFFEGLDQVTSIIDLSPMQVVSVDFSLYSSASGQNLVLVAEGEEHKYTVEIEKDVTTKPINIITSDKDYSNQEINDLIEEVELVTAAGFNNLNERVLQNKSDIDELEEVTSVSLNGLNERVEDLEDDVRNIEEIVDKGHLQEIKWAELKNLRDNAQLIPGYFYRITDYKCTTTQSETRSVGNQFDIILLALSENTLSEEGWAAKHQPEVYEITFAEGVTKRAYLYESIVGPDGYRIVNYVEEDSLLGTDLSEILANLGLDVDEGLTIDYENKTANVFLYYDGDSRYDIKNNLESGITYDYFKDSNLSAWKVWYCLDNDKSRFAWAMDKDYIKVSGVVYYRNPIDDIPAVGVFGWYNGEDETIYTNTDNPQIGDHVYDYEGRQTNLTVKDIIHGHGVIYRLIDEFNNDCPYDFKNIQFKRCQMTTFFTGTAYHVGIYNGGLPSLNSIIPSDYDYYYTFSYRSSKDVPVLDSSIFANTVNGSDYSPTTDSTYRGNFDLRNQVFKRNVDCADVFNNTIKELVLFIEVGEQASTLLRKQFLNNIVLFGGNCLYNFFDINCYNFSLIKSSTVEITRSNYFGSECHGFLIYGSYNNVGSDCNECYINGSHNTIGQHCSSIRIGNSPSNSCSYNTIEKSCSTITLGGTCSYNTFRESCSEISLAMNNSLNTFGKECKGINFNKTYYKYITVESGNKYINLNCTATTSYSQYYQNVTIAKGISGSFNNRKTISDSNVNQNFQTIYKPANCQEISV